MNYNSLTKPQLLKLLKDYEDNFALSSEFDEFCKNIFDSLSDAVIITDKVGNLKSVNHVFKKYFGLDEKGNINLQNFKTIEGNDLKNIFNNVIKKKNPEIARIKLNGSVFNFRISVFKKSGSSYLVVLNNEINENEDKENIEKLLKNDVFKNFVNNINVGITVLNPDMEIVFTNSLIQKKHPELNVPERKEKLLCYKIYNQPPKNKICENCPCIKTFKDGNVYEYITVTETKDGIKNFRIISSPIKNKSGKVEYVIELSEDITSQVYNKNLLENQIKLTEGIIDSLPSPILYKDINGIYKLCNRAFTEFQNSEKQHITGKTVFNFFPSAEAEKYHKMDVDLIRSGKIQTIETRTMHKKSNEEKVIIVTKALLKDYENNLAGIISIALDITDRKKDELKILNYQNSISNLIDTANIIIISLDLEGNILLFNKKAEEITGYSKGEILGKNYFEYIVPRNRYPDVYRSFTDYTKSGYLKNPESDNFILSKTGKERLISWRNSPVKVNNILSGILAFGTDVTDEKENEFLIKKLRIAIDNSSDSVIITDKNGNIQYVNPAFIKLTGYSYLESAGQNPRILKSNKMKPEFYADLWNTISRGDDWEGEFLNRKKNGALFFEYCRISSIKNSNNEITNFIAVKTDISEVKKLKEERESLKKSVQDANHIKHSLLSKLNYEFRTPLIEILGFAEILNNEVTDKWQTEIISKISKQGKKLLKSFNNIMKLSQIETNSFATINKRFNIKKVLKDIFSDYTPSALENNFNLVLNTFDDEIYGFTDPAVLKDIISNIMEYILNTFIQGDVLTDLNVINDTAELIITHQSKEVSDVDNNRIINLEKNIINFSETNVNDITLLLSFRLAEVIKCKLLFENIADSVSRFKINIPLYVSEISKDEKKAESLQISSSEEKSKTKLLLVEDNASNINIVEIFLNEICNIDSLTSGEEALKKSLKVDYDIILLDINLGEGIDGISTVKQFRQIYKYKHTPVIAVTGYAMPSDKESLKSEGFTDYLQKPFTKIQLINLIKKYV